MQTFREILAPLEEKARSRLNGVGLNKCFAAFTRDAERFRELAVDALLRGRNPVALLVRMVNDGDLDLPPLPPPQQPPHARGVVDDCIACGQCRELDAQTLRCQECERGEAP